MGWWQRSILRNVTFNFQHSTLKLYSMRNAITRFNFYLDQLQALMIKAAKQKNPGLWLYQNNARTPLFMLEGLAKLYAGLHNKKKFTKLKEHFKLLEDILGAVDYYDAFAKEFANNKNIPANVTAYLQAQAREKIQSLNEALKEDEWLGAGKNRIDKIRKKLEEADWKKSGAEIKCIKDFYDKSIAEIIEFVGKTNCRFTNVESEVHESRRKLRWLSIYPQALRGCIQLTSPTQKSGQPKTNTKALEKYLVPEITNSPFNKMPDAGDNNDFLLLHQNYFYALSWMIAELGKLKDSGLRLVAIREALQQTSSISDEDALAKAKGFIGGDQPDIPQVLIKANQICATYFKEQTLAKLVIGCANAL